ncbi:MAG: ATP-binding protein [Betaproteobacteria bacterium]
MSGETTPSPVPPVPREVVDAPTLAAPRVPGTLMPALSPVQACVIALALVLMIALVDYELGFEIRLTILYVVPVALVTWVCGRLFGYALALVSTLVWAISLETVVGYSRPIYFYWDAVVLGMMLWLFAELLSRLHRALAHSDERFVRVLEGIDAAVYVIDDAGALLYANPRLARLVGDPATPPTAERIAGRFDVHGEKSPARSQPAAWPDGAQLADRRDGRRYTVQARDITWVDGRGAHLLVMSDVTDQAMAQELQRDHQNALHRTARIVALTEAASTLAHELNQPLLAIVGYSAASTRLLAQPGSDHGEVRAALEKTHAQAVRAGEILKHLRELTRRRTPEFDACDVNAMVRKALAWTAHDLERAQVGVDLDLAGGLPEVRADRVLIEQVLLNLVQNAVDAMRDVAARDRRLAIATGSGTDGTTRVTISDQGHGIAPDVAERLFSPFYTTKRGGMGLGLSICRSIVEMHGGRIGHGPGLRGGAAFHFTFPRAR